MGDSIEQQINEQRKRIQLLKLKEEELAILSKINDHENRLGRPPSTTMDLVPVTSSSAQPPPSTRRSDSDAVIRRAPLSAVTQPPTSTRRSDSDAVVRRAPPAAVTQPPPSTRRSDSDGVIRRAPPRQPHNLPPLELKSHKPPITDEEIQKHWKGKRIKVYRNGDKFYSGHDFVINGHNCRTMRYLLRSITEVLPVEYAVKRLYTPTRGTEVTNLDELKNRGQYVAVPMHEKLQLMKYPNMKGEPIINQENSQRDELKTGAADSLTNRQALQPIFENEQDNDDSNGRMIFVYSNGEHTLKAVNVFIDKEELFAMHSVMRAISKGLGLVYANSQKIHRLYTLSGIQCRSSGDIKHGHEYVAAGHEMFLALPYGQETPRLTVSRVRYHKATEPIRYLDSPLTPPKKSPRIQSSRNQNRLAESNELLHANEDSDVNGNHGNRDGDGDGRGGQGQSNRKRFDFEETDWQLERDLALIRAGNPQASVDKEITAIICVGSEPEVCLTDGEGRLQTILATNPRACDSGAVTIREFNHRLGGCWTERRLRVAHQLGCSPGTVDLHAVGSNLILVHSQHPNKPYSSLVLVRLLTGYLAEELHVPLWFNHCAFDPHAEPASLWACQRGAQGKLHRWRLPGLDQPDEMRLPALDEIIEIRPSARFLALWDGAQVHLLSRSDWTEVLVVDAVDSCFSFAFDSQERLYVQHASPFFGVSVWRGDGSEVVSRTVLPPLVRGGRRQLRFHQDPHTGHCWIREPHHGWRNLLVSADLLLQRLQRSHNPYPLARTVDWRKLANHTLPVGELTYL